MSSEYTFPPAAASPKEVLELKPNSYEDATEGPHPQVDPTMYVTWTKPDGSTFVAPLSNSETYVRKGYKDSSAEQIPDLVAWNAENAAKEPAAGAEGGASDQRRTRRGAESEVLMPVDSGSIAGQVGAAGGLWTHTPVDYRGNETGQAPPGPAGWPTDAYVAVPPAGTVPPPGGSAPTISAISVSGITATTATVNFTVSPSSSSVVEYGTTTAYGSVTAADSGTGARTRPLSGLTTATLYHYRVVSTANGLTTYSTDRTFTTA